MNTVKYPRNFGVKLHDSDKVRIWWYRTEAEARTCLANTLARQPERKPEYITKAS